RGGHGDYLRTRPAVTRSDQKTEVRCSMTFEHEHGKLRIDAESWCPRINTHQSPTSGPGGRIVAWLSARVVDALTRLYARRRQIADDDVRFLRIKLYRGSRPRVGLRTGVLYGCTTWISSGPRFWGPATIRGTAP